MNKYTIAYEKDGVLKEVVYNATSYEQAEENFYMDFSKDNIIRIITSDEKHTIDKSILKQGFNKILEDRKKERAELYGFKDEFLDKIKEMMKSE